MLDLPQYADATIRTGRRLQGQDGRTNFSLAALNIRSNERASESCLWVRLIGSSITVDSLESPW